MMVETAVRNAFPDSDYGYEMAPCVCVCGGGGVGSGLEKGEHPHWLLQGERRVCLI